MLNSIPVRCRSPSQPTPHIHLGLPHAFCLNISLYKIASIEGNNAILQWNPAAHPTNRSASSTERSQSVEHVSTWSIVHDAMDRLTITTSHLTVRWEIPRRSFTLARAQR